MLTSSPPPLPHGFEWRRVGPIAEELCLWRVTAVARVEKWDGAWIATVNLCFHASLHRQAHADSELQACYWVHRWAIKNAETLYKARPEACAQLGR